MVETDNALSGIQPDEDVRAAVDSVFELLQRRQTSQESMARIDQASMARIETAIRMQIATYPFSKPSDPPDDLEIGRILSPEKFIRFLSNPSLYFQPPRYYEDPHEGTYPSKVITGHQKGFEEYIRTKQQVDGSEQTLAFSAFGFSGLSRAFLSAANEGFPIGAASCWTSVEPHGSSELMWRSYADGRNGVGIKTTYGRLKSILKDLLDQADGSIFLFSGKIDYTLDEMRVHPAFRKRPQFSSENEIRFFAPKLTEPMTFSLGLESESAFQTFYSEDVDRGFEIHAENLIQSLCVQFFESN